MIDFTNCKKLGVTYGGSEKKKKVVYDGDVYLLKFPDPVREKGNSLSYMNNQYSEYIGCHIFESLGIEAQKTLLGTYTENNFEKVVVACKDFTSPTRQLTEFTKLANSVTSTDQSFSCCIEDLYEVLNLSSISNVTDVISSFWDMFVVDALIANPDRHMDNWGLLYDVYDDEYTFSPVYDCGSSLHALLSPDRKDALLYDDSAFKNAVFNVASAYRMNGKRIFYHEIFKNPPDDLKAALLRTAPKIDMDKIYDIVDSVPHFSDIEKDFCLKSIELRKEQIIDKALNKAIKDRNRNMNDLEL